MAFPKLCKDLPLKFHSGFTGNNTERFLSQTVVYPKAQNRNLIHITHGLEMIQNYYKEITLAWLFSIYIMLYAQIWNTSIIFLAYILKDERWISFYMTFLFISFPLKLNSRVKRLRKFHNVKPFMVTCKISYSGYIEYWTDQLCF